MDLYVAVVCDTDGSAFITKAEFDSLKTSFQVQVDNYNHSIDSKIDGAIAAYLTGIKINEDNTPKYKVGGFDMGSRLGLGRVRGLCVWMTGPTVWSGSSWTSDWGKDNIWILSSSPSPLSGVTSDSKYWIKGVCNNRTSPYSTHVYSDDEVPVMCVPTLGSIVRVFYQSGSTIQQETATSYISKPASCATWEEFADMFGAYEYSKAIGEFVSVFEPKVTCYHFMDEGDITFLFMYTCYGYDCERRSGMVTQNFTNWGTSSWRTKTTKVKWEKADGTEEILMEIVGPTDPVCEEPIYYTRHVRPGDKVTVQLGSNTDCHGNSSGYMWWSSSLSGWEEISSI